MANYASTKDILTYVSLTLSNLSEVIRRLSNNAPDNDFILLNSNLTHYGPYCQQEQPPGNFQAQGNTETNTNPNISENLTASAAPSKNTRHGTKSNKQQAFNIPLIQQ